MIGLTWIDGISDGGMPVIDYTVQYDQATGDWIDLESGVVNQYYQTTIALNPGEVYQFRVKARSSVGLSPASNTASI